MLFFKRSLFLILFVFLGGESFSQPDSSFYQVGDTVPSFSGVDQFDDTLNIEDYLNEQPVLLVFYRGHWCPYCSRHVSEIHDSFEKLKSKNVKVILVTPEQPEYAQKMIDSKEITYSVVADNDLSIINLFHLGFEVNDSTVTSHYSFVAKKSAEANGNEAPVLPVPATYLIGKDGVIKYVHYDKNYKERSNIKELIELIE